MERQGYKVKRQNKNISFCTDGRERFMRSKTLGTDYTIEALKNRIDRKSTHKSINLIIDIQNCIKAQENKGYEHWAKINNLKQAAKTLNFLTEHNLTTYEDLEKTAEQKQKSFTDISDKIKSVEKEINTAAMLIKHIETYSRIKPIMQKRKSAKDKEQFDNKHRSEMILFEAALNELKSADFPPIKALKTKYNLLTEQKENLYAEYKKAKAEATEIDVVKSNVDSLLGVSHKPSRDISAHLEQ